jgi:hypothetical protein
MATNARVAPAAFLTVRYVDEEGAAELLERRWFAASGAAKNLKAECDVLLGVLQLSEDAWRRACAQLAQLEAFRDELGKQLAVLEEPCAAFRDAAITHGAMSAA